MPGNQLEIATLEGTYRKKPIVARFERWPEGWFLQLTIDGKTQPAPIKVRNGDKPCWAVATHLVDEHALIERVPRAVKRR